MARFLSISLVAVVISNLFAFAQKYEPVPMCLFVQESDLENQSFSDGSLETADKAAPMTLNIHNTFNSNYLTLEVFGLSKAVPFQLVNSQGVEMYTGTISGTQLIETESWPAGTYYFLCGNRRETVYIMR
ncbi:hypothetical protein [Fluviicola sp.]|uniref:hypothetical protein n=1 Tax=Fluviicola sp. TaxID=1917219 RepID=UPI0031D9173B